MTKPELSRRQKWERLNRRIVRCKKCPRLIEHCQTIARVKRKAYENDAYWGRPVENMGWSHRQLLVVGLAPGAHGANRTGRMFTGDRSGDWLFRALHRAGFASQSESSSRGDGLKLKKCAITAVCNCAPPDNKPSREEINNCRGFLEETIELTNPRVFLALGKLAFDETLRFCQQQKWLSESQGDTNRTKSQPCETDKPPNKASNRMKLPKFGHGQTVSLTKSRWIVASYHPSQQNTFTGRLTEAMLDEIMYTVAHLIP